MRLLYLICLFLWSFAAQALDQDIEVDILANRVTTLLKAGNHAQALPLFEKLESMNVKLPESFDYYYIEALDKAGNNVKAYERSEMYLKKYGKKGKYYGQTIDTLSRLSPQIEQARIQAIAAVVELAELERQMVQIPYSQSFLIGKTEVTQALWLAVMGNNPSNFAQCDSNCPVEGVSWDDIQLFIKKLNIRTGKSYRLPTEQEWEYACLAGAQTEYCGSDNLEAVGWYDYNSGGKTHRVSAKQSNAWGLYDMTGNVWEWTDSCSSSGCAYRVVRGGSISNEILGTRAGAWRSDIASLRRSDYGFRLARTAP